VTDIARANHRSLKAHQKVGFEVIHAIEYEGLTWDVVLCVSTVPKPVESCRFENHDIAVFLGDVFFRIERQRFFLLQVFFPVISTGVI
jgi:hypothetical protein